MIDLSYIACTNIQNDYHVGCRVLYVFVEPVFVLKQQDVPSLVIEVSECSPSSLPLCIV